MPLFQGFRPVAGTICPSSAAAVVGPPRASQGMKKGRRPRRRPRLKLSDRAGPDQCPVPGENALFPAQIAGFLAVSRPVPVYPVFLSYVVPVQWVAFYHLILGRKKAGDLFQISCSVCRCVGGGYLVIKVRGKLTRCEVDKLKFMVLHRCSYFNQITVQIIKTNYFLSPTMCHKFINILN